MSYTYRVYLGHIYPLFLLYSYPYNSPWYISFPILHSLFYFRDHSYFFSSPPFTKGQSGIVNLWCNKIGSQGQMGEHTFHRKLFKFQHYRQNKSYLRHFIQTFYLSFMLTTTFLSWSSITFYMYGCKQSYNWPLWLHFSKSFSLLFRFSFIFQKANRMVFLKLKSGHISSPEQTP